MIKLKAFLLSLVLVIATLALLNVTYVKKIDDYYKVKDNSIRYSTSYEKYKSIDIKTYPKEKDYTDTHIAIIPIKFLTTTILISCRLGLVILKTSFRLLL